MAFGAPSVVSRPSPFCHWASLVIAAMAAIVAVVWLNCSRVYAPPVSV